MRKVRQNILISFMNACICFAPNVIVCKKSTKTILKEDLFVLVFCTELYSVQYLVKIVYTNPQKII